MSKMKNSVLFLLISAFCGTLPGQEARLPAPIILRPASPMAWKMTSVKAPTASAHSSSAESASSTSKPLQPTSLEYILSDGLLKITVNFEDGSHQEYWKAEDVFLSHIGKRNEIQVLSGELPRFPCAARGFYGIENVKLEHANGIANSGGTPCQYFQGKRVATPLEHPVFAGDTEPLSEVQYEAWFDIRSGLPKAYRAGGKTWVFEFLPTPPSHLTLPAEWQAALDKYHLDQRRAGLER